MDLHPGHLSRESGNPGFGLRDHEPSPLCPLSQWARGIVGAQFITPAPMLVFPAKTGIQVFPACHCEERSDAAIPAFYIQRKFSCLSLTGLVHYREGLEEDAVSILEYFGYDFAGKESKLAARLLTLRCGQASRRAQRKLSATLSLLAARLHLIWSFSLASIALPMHHIGRYLEPKRLH